LELSRELAKQVLSQLSYTPTVGTAIDVKAFAAVRKPRKLAFCPLGMNPYFETIYCSKLYTDARRANKEMASLE